MRFRSKFILLGVAMLLAAPNPASLAAAEHPKTVRDLILELGKLARGNEQLRLKIAGEAEGEEVADMPREMVIELRYDQRTNRILMVTDSVYRAGVRLRSTVFADAKSAVRWSRDEGDGKLHVVPLEPTLTLPNPWTLPAKLAFPGLFADSLQGYEALAREFSRSVPLNREPDEAGELWFELRPSANAGRAMLREFTGDLEVKAGFAAETGLLKALAITHKKPHAVLTMRVVEESTELSEEDMQSLAIPDEVMAVIRETPKQLRTPDKAAVGKPERKLPERLKKPGGATPAPAGGGA